MTLDFSQRMGLKPHKKELQETTMDNELRSGLWNAVFLIFFKNCLYERLERTSIQPIILSLYADFFKVAIDNTPSYINAVSEEVKKFMYGKPYNEVFCLIEFIANNRYVSSNDEFCKQCNFYLRRENSNYRFVNSIITPIVSEDEIKEIEEAISSSEVFPGAKEHLTTALKLMSDKTNPDYRNSIKESISAIESITKDILNDEKGTLGELIKKLKADNNLHSAFTKSISNLYGFSSDKEGIRHALKSESDLTKSEARYILIVSSAFINYLIDLSAD